MGAPMARHLVDAGYQVSVYNRTASKADAAKQWGAYVAPSLAHLGERSEIVITMVTDPQAVRETIEGPNGLLARPQKGLVWIQMSTLDVQSTLSFARFAEDRSVIFVDA